MPLLFDVCLRPHTLVRAEDARAPLLLDSLFLSRSLSHSLTHSHTQLVRAEDARAPLLLDVSYALSLYLSLTHSLTHTAGSR